MSDQYVIGADPGPKNFGVAVYRKSAKNRAWKLLGTDKLHYPITKLTTPKYQKQARRFRREWNKHLAEYPSTHGTIILERFMSRLHRNNASETVNVMLGILTNITQIHHWDIILITPATWKNQYHRKFGENTIKELYQKVAVSNHEVDAALIGRYQIDRFAQFKLTKRWLKALENFPFE